MFFFPFSDDNPTQNTPYVTYFLIGVCCFIFLWQFTLPPQLFESAVYNFGVVPASLLGSKEGYLPATTTIFTSMFMHGGWMHLIGNMLLLWIFGDNVEDSMGRVKFIIFYQCTIYDWRWSRISEGRSNYVYWSTRWACSNYFWSKYIQNRYSTNQSWIEFQFIFWPCTIIK